MVVVDVIGYGEGTEVEAEIDEIKGCFETVGCFGKGDTLIIEDPEEKLQEDDCVILEGRGDDMYVVIERIIDDKTQVVFEKPMDECVVN